MLFKNLPIRKKLLRIVFLINGIVLLVAGMAFFGNEFYSFRETTVEKLSTIGKIIAANSTAALAFDSPDDAREILAALKAEPHIVAACIYDKNGRIFSEYYAGNEKTKFPPSPGPQGYKFSYSNLDGFVPVMQETLPLGTLYLRSDMGALHAWLGLYAIVVAVILLLSFLLAYILVIFLGKSISKPIMALSETAKIISERKDYTVRAIKMSNDELGSLTEAFNQMLDQIKKKDDNLSEFNQNLELKVKDRTAQLETVNKELEGFSYSVSHDLRAPLRAIVGFASILEEEYANRLDVEGKRITTIIKKNTVKMGRLIDDLLEFSRMGRLDGTKTTVNMQKMVNDVKDAIALQYDTHRVSWSVGDLPSVNANASMIRQVWVNLITNAIKYSSKNEAPQIEIGAMIREGEYVYYVDDNGVGFEQQYSDKLFKVFQRLHSPEEFEGTGVGLALVKKIVTREGGSVWVESEVGKGACFYFSLPVRNEIRVNNQINNESI